MENNDKYSGQSGFTVGHHFCNVPFTQFGTDYIASLDPATDTPEITITKVYYERNPQSMTEQSINDGYEIITAINPNYAEVKDFGSNNVIMGIEAGLHFTNESNKVIIGDNIRSMDKTQPNVLFIGDNVAIGKTLFGKPINLFDVITEYYEEINRNPNSI